MQYQNKELIPEQLDRLAKLADDGDEQAMIKIASLLDEWQVVEYSDRMGERIPRRTQPMGPCPFEMEEMTWAEQTQYLKRVIEYFANGHGNFVERLFVPVAQLQQRQSDLGG